MAGSIAGHNAENAAVRDRNNAIAKNNYIQQREYDVKANLDNVQYINDVQEKDVEDDRTYQAMLDTMSDTDFQMKSLFEDYDQQIEDAIIEMHANSYAGTQTGRTAARLAGKSAIEAGRKKSRALHNKMMAVKDTTRQKERTYTAAKNDSHKLYMDVAFAPIHGPRPAYPADLESGPSKAGLILGLAGTGLGAAKDLGAFKAKKIGKD